jgi:MATE family multidrug resistance protein
LANLILDYALIFGNWGFPEMGISGAATASVIAAMVSLLIFIFLIFSQKNNDIYQVWAGRCVEKALLFRLIRYGLPSGIQFFLDMAGFTFFVLLVGRLGMVSLAATNIAFNINMLAFLPMTGIGMAVSVLVGQYLGKENAHTATISVYSGFHLTFIYMTSVATAYVLVPDIFITPFAVRSDPEKFAEIYRTTVILLRFVAVYSVFDSMNIIFASAIKGAGDTRFIMLMILLLTSFGLAIPTYVAIVILDFGLMTAWVIATVYVILLGFTFYVRFLGGKWQTMRVIEGPYQMNLEP